MMLRWVKPVPKSEVPTLKNHTATLVGDKVRVEAKLEGGGGSLGWAISRLARVSKGLGACRGLPRAFSFMYSYARSPTRVPTPARRSTSSVATMASGTTTRCTSSTPRRCAGRSSTLGAARRPVRPRFLPHACSFHHCSAYTDDDARPAFFFSPGSRSERAHGHAGGGEALCHRRLARERASGGQRRALPRPRCV